MIIYAHPGQIINLGRAGENESVQVQFNLYKWVEQYGSGNVTLFYAQLGSEVSELSFGTIDNVNPIFAWNVSNSITQNSNTGRCQLSFEPDGGATIVSPWYQTVVTTSVYSEPAPTQSTTWIDELQDAIAELTPLLDAGGEINDMTADATSVNYDEPAAVNVTKVANTGDSGKHFNLSFRIPAGRPFQIMGTFGNVQAIYDAWANYAESDLVLIQADSGIDNGAIYCRVAKRNPATDIPSGSTIHTITRTTLPDPTCRIALEAKIANPSAGDYAVVDSKFVFICKTAPIGSAPAEWEALWMEGWDYLTTIEGAQGIKGDQGYQGISLTAITIDSTGKFTGTFYNPATGTSTTSAITSSTYYEQIATWRSEAQAAADKANQWVDFTTGGTPTSTNNAKYYATQARTSATQASTSATTSSNKALVSEGYALGTQNGTAVGSSSPYYQNNSKYFYELFMSGIHMGNSAQGEDANALYFPQI